MSPSAAFHRTSFERALAIHFLHCERGAGQRGKDSGSLTRPVPDPRGGAALRRATNVLLRDGLRPRSNQTGERGVASRERPRPPQLRRGEPAPRGPDLGPQGLRSSGTTRRILAAPAPLPRFGTFLGPQPLLFWPSDLPLPVLLSVV